MSTNTDTYDFLINDDDLLLLTYARETKPEAPSIEIDEENFCATLYRSQNDGINIKDIPEEVMDILTESKTLLVCEMSMEENDDDTKIIYAYEAEIRI